MKNKGFTDLNTEIKTPNDFSEAGKPLKRRVDINLLKSKLQETESREFKKNLIILRKSIKKILFTILTRFQVMKK